MAAPKFTADEYIGLVHAVSALETNEQDEDEASADSVNASRALDKVWALLPAADKESVLKWMKLTPPER
jgi:ribonuclease HI